MALCIKEWGLLNWKTILSTVENKHQTNQTNTPKKPIWSDETKEL